MILFAYIGFRFAHLRCATRGRIYIYRFDGYSQMQRGSSENMVFCICNMDYILIYKNVFNNNNKTRHIRCWDQKTSLDLQDIAIV